MAELDPSIILAGTSKAKAPETPNFQDITAASIQNAQGRQKIESNQLTINSQQQELSDNQKLTEALKGIDPNSPDYEKQVIAATAKAGISGKTQLQLQQNFLNQQSEKLKNTGLVLNIKEQYMKLSANEKAVYDGQINEALETMGNVESAWKTSNGNKALVQTLIQKDLADEVEQKKITPEQAKALANKVMPGGIFDYNAFSNAYDQTKGVHAALETAKAKQDIERSKAETDKAEREKFSAVQANVPVDPNDPSKGTKTVFATLNQATGDIKPSDVTAAGKPGTSSPEQQTELAKGIANYSIDPKTLTARGNRDAILAEAKKINPDFNQNEAAVYHKEALVLGTRKGAIETASEAITEQGGAGDQYVDAIDGLDLSRLKPGKDFETFINENISNPKYAKAALAAQALASEYSTVIARGGQSTEGSRQDAYKAVGMLRTKDEARALVKQIKKEADGAERAVDTKIANLGKKNTKTDTSKISTVQEAISAGWQLHSDANGNKAYVSPDGKEFVETK